MIRNVLKHKKLLISILLIGIFFYGGIANAGPIDVAVTTVVGWLVSLVILVTGMIFTITIKTVISIANYNNFINEEIVIDAWVIIRDLCNMFFILVLLVIAFATILRVESYNWKKLLPKLLIMAVLINFSRTISGLIIDFSQIMMATFVSAFTDGGGNFVALLKVDQMVAAAKANTTWSINGKLDLTNTVAGMMAGAIFLLISAVVMLVILAVLVMRIVMLWVYVILSPLAFLMSAFPAGQKYASQWWSEFTKNVISGPVLAFFIWISLMSVSKINVAGIGKIDATAYCSGPTNILCDTSFMGFVISIGLLVGGLIVTQQIGGAAAGIAGKGMAALQRGQGLAWGGVKGVAGLGSYAQRKFAGSKYGFETRPGKIIAGIKQSLERTKNKDEIKAQQRGATLLGKGGLRAVVGGAGVGADWADQYVSGFANIRGIKNIAHSIRWGEGSRDKLQKQYEAKKDKVEKNYGNVSTTDERNVAQDELVGNNKRINKLDSDISAAYQNNDSEKARTLEAQKKRIEETNKALEKTISLDVSIDKEKLEKEIKDMKIKMAEVRPAKSLEARATYRAAINTEKAKVKDVTNADELLLLYNDATRNKDKYRAAAIFEKLTNDANENELLNQRGYKSNAVGLHQFVQNEIVGSGLMSKDEGLQLMNDIGEAAERVGHWDTAKTVGVNEVGQLVSLVKEIKDSAGNITGYDDSRHALASASEIYKIDPQAVMRQLNRLSFGGERPNADGTRTFELSTLGKILTKGMSKAFIDHKNRILANTAFNLAQPHIQEIMVKIGVDPDAIKQIVDRGGSEGRSNSPGDILKDLKSKNLA